MVLQMMSTTHTARNSSSNMSGMCILCCRGGSEGWSGSYTLFFQILQLYVAAYQSPAIWKEAWKHLVGVISVQIIRDVEVFVAKHPFADAEVMRFVVAS